MNAIFLQSVLIIDTVLVTPLGEETLAALGLATSFAALLAGVLFAFSSGTQLLLAQAHGGKNEIEIETRFWSGLMINFIIAGVGLGIIFAAGPRLFMLLATTTLMAEQAFQYLSVFSVAVLCIAIAQNLSVYFNAIGKSRIPFYSNLIELPINAVLSYLLIHGKAGFPEMGITGASIGSGVAIFIRAIFLTGALYRSKPHYFHRNPKRRKLSSQAIADHYWRALPIAGNFVTMSISINVCMMIYARLGVTQFAVLTLLFPWIRVAGHIVTSWSTATGILVGQILGGDVWEGLDEFVSRAWRVALILGGVVSAMYFGMFFLFGVVYPDLQPETRLYLWQLMPLLVVLPLIRTSNTICGHVLRAGGDAGYVFKVHASTQWLLTVPMTAAFVLYFDLGVVWVFAVVVLEELVKAIPFHLRMWSGQWKRKIVVELS